jgi:hypothetical protein
VRSVAKPGTDNNGSEPKKLSSDLIRQCHVYDSGGGYVRSWVPEVMRLDEPGCFAPWLEGLDPPAGEGYPPPCVEVSYTIPEGGGSGGEPAAGPWHGCAADRVKVGGERGGILRFLDFDQAKVGAGIGAEGGEIKVKVLSLAGGGEAGGAGGMCVGLVPSTETLAMSWGRCTGIGWVVTTGQNTTQTLNPKP